MNIAGQKDDRFSSWVSPPFPLQQAEIPGETSRTVELNQICSFGLGKSMEEIKKLLLLVLGCAVQVRTGRGGGGPPLSRLGLGFPRKEF